MRRSDNPFDTAIYVRVKRHTSTFFILCDEYEEVGAFKSRLINTMSAENGFVLPFKFEEKLQVEDIKLCLKNRVLENGASCHDQ